MLLCIQLHPQCFHVPQKNCERTLSESTSSTGLSHSLRIRIILKVSANERFTVSNSTHGKDIDATLLAKKEWEVYWTFHIPLATNLEKTLIAEKEPTALTPVTQRAKSRTQHSRLWTEERKIYQRHQCKTVLNAERERKLYWICHTLLDVYLHLLARNYLHPLHLH